MKFRLRKSTALIVFLSACALEPPAPEDLDEAGYDVLIAAQQTLPNTAVTRLVMLRSSTEGALRIHPVILSAPHASDRPAWSTAFRLLCNDCKRGLEAFGYSMEDALFAVQYQTEDVLRADNQVPDARTLPFIDLPFEATDLTPAIRAAFRVVDADKPEDPRYIVRLETAPQQLYSTTCENFLRVGQGHTNTVPITKALLAHWNVAAPLPAIGCSSVGGKGLPAPAAAPPQTPPLSFAYIEQILRTNQPGPSSFGEAYPYVVARERSGDALRGYAVACGSDARGALQSLGVEFADIRSEPATQKELFDTGFGAQPTIRCRGPAASEILEITSSNDTSKKKRFRFGSDHDLIEFACKDTETYWSTQATRRLVDVPYQALPYLSDFGDGRGKTRIFTLGCRSKDLCAQVLPGALPECKAATPAPVDAGRPPPIDAGQAPQPVTPPVPPDQAAEGGRNGCVYVQFCDFPNAAGAVCRTHSGCALNDSAISECRSDLNLCATPTQPIYICNRSSTDCRRL